MNRNHGIYQSERRYPQSQICGTVSPEWRFRIARNTQCVKNQNVSQNQYSLQAKIQEEASLPFHQLQHKPHPNLDPFHIALTLIG